MAENIIDTYSELPPTVPELPAPEIPPTVPQLPAPEIPPTVPDSELPDPELQDIIPDYLLQIINSQAGENITGANYLTRTAAGQVVTPSGQAVDPNIDLNQIAMDFDNTVNSILAADSVQIPLEWRINSPQSVVTNPFLVESLTNIPITHNVNYFEEAPVFTDANQLQSLLARISSATLGSTQNRFVYADDDDNLIEMRPVDAAQSGGLRAWGGNDRVLGTEDNDIANGDAGNDRMVGADGHDLLRGGEGNDEISGGEGDDLVKGDEGDDCLFGGAGKDVLLGGAGRDVVIGNAGDDILIGRNDGDLLIGKEGADQFILRADMFANSAAFADRICDFNSDEGDRIKIVSSPGMDAISFAAVDVNLDGIQDTAILCSGVVQDVSSNDGGGVPYRGVVGVIMSKAPSTMDLTSIFMVAPQDTTLSLIG